MLLKLNIYRNDVLYLMGSGESAYVIKISLNWKKTYFMNPTPTNC